MDEQGNYTIYPVRAPSSGHLFGYNILQGVNQEVRKGQTAQTVSSFTASYEIAKGLTLTGLAGIDAALTRDDNQRPATVPLFANDRGQVSITNRRTFNYNTNLVASYTRKIGTDHTISALVGYEYKAQD